MDQPGDIFDLRDVDDGWDYYSQSLLEVVMENKPTRITVHCSDSPDGIDVSYDTVKSWHIERGFSDIGYHYLIHPDGGYHSGRPLNVVGAHVEGFNQGNIGICLIGRDKFTLAQFKALALIIYNVQLTYDIPDWEVSCHYEYSSAQKQGKTCPNIKISHLLGWIMLEDINAINSYLMPEKAREGGI